MENYRFLRKNIKKPSTTSTASNYPDVLTRPSLHRSHLNFSMLESPALHCQPSTSSAFPIGSSGFSLVKEIKDSTSQHDDDNISTTSGFSSRASDKENSPIFRRQMKAKQLSAQSYGVTSSTARRILQSLEKMSSPLAPLDRSGIDVTDFQAKREKEVIMTGYEKNMTPGQNREQRESGFSYPNFSLPAANGLSSGGGKMRRERTRFVASKAPEKEKQNHVLVKVVGCLSFLHVYWPPIFILANCQLHSGQQFCITGFFTQSFPSLALFHPEGIMNQMIELVQVPVLPKISLPITSSSLPTFNFSSPGITASSPSPISSSQSLTNKIGFTFSVPVAKTAELPGSSSTVEPILSSSAEDVTAVNSRSCKKTPPEDCEGPFRPAKILKEGSVLDLLKSPGFASPKIDSLVAQPTTTSPLVYTRPAISSFSSSGTGFGESSKAGSSWQCDTCLLQNKVTDNKCIACQAAKLSPRDTAKQTGIETPNKSGKTTLSASGTGFGDKFKPVIGTWDCDTCLVQNKPEVVKCVACETPKPGTGVKRVLTLTVVSESAETVTASSSSCTVTTGTLGFGDKFKRPIGSWECSVCCVSNKAEDNKCVSCMSEKPERKKKNYMTLIASEEDEFQRNKIRGLEKFKKPEGSWECDVCLVQNKADSTKCVACESAKPGTKSEFKVRNKRLCFPELQTPVSYDTSSSSSNPAASSSFKFGIPSSSSGSSQTLTSTGNFKFGDQGGFKISVSSDSGSVNPVSEGFKFSKPIGDFKFGVSSESKPEEVKKDSKNDNFKFGLSSGLSNPVSLTPFQFGVSNLGQQEKKEELPKSSSAGFSFGTGVINPTPAAANTLVTSENKSSFNFGTIEAKSASVAPFTCKTSEAKEEMPATKGGFTFGNMEPASPPSATVFVLGRTEEKQQEPVTSTSLVFGKKADSEEPKCQPVFSFGNSDQTKDENSSKSTFSFSMTKPSEKESEQPAKATFAFGAQTSTTTDQGASKPVFNFLNNNPSNSSTPATSAGGGIFGSSTSSSNPPVATFVFGQSSNPVSSSAFGNSAESSTSQSLLFSQDSKLATTSSTGTAVTPFVFGPGASSNSTATSGFSFGATTTSSSAGSSFVFGTGPSVPSASPAFGANQTPTFGQSQGASQPNPPGFGSISSSTALFSTGSQPAPPTFGTVSSSSQPPVFGQQPSQSAFGSGTTPNSSKCAVVLSPGCPFPLGSVFQFGSSTTNFNFTNNNPSGVFTFGANSSTPAASAQPSGSGGFPFNPSPAFTVG
ncbi:hypothetical protein P7K49_007259 [Saguinus oedipus]|uniref:Nuclear pore complex protein Nup153 n=1 Tax=Saguinus oedipus TaxID=9490 RepID=A0ABQ9VUC0_SAGOE|nr:hypothetical protein P7K49_007259 [Saguinus oedipus]